MSEAEQILRDLAARPAPLADAGSHVACALCDVAVPLVRSQVGVHYELLIGQHATWCPYRRALEWKANRDQSVDRARIVYDPGTNQITIFGETVPGVVAWSVEHSKPGTTRIGLELAGAVVEVRP
jgi:hypothetical protein